MKTPFLILASLVALGSLGNFSCFAQAQQPAPPNTDFKAPKPSHWVISSRTIKMKFQKPEQGEIPIDAESPAKIFGGKSGDIRYWRYVNKEKTVIERWFINDLFLDRVVNGVAIRDMRMLGEDDFLPPAATQDFDYVDWVKPEMYLGQVISKGRVFNYFALVEKPGTAAAAAAPDLSTVTRTPEQATEALPGVSEIWVDNVTGLPHMVILGRTLFTYDIKFSDQGFSVPKDLRQIANQYYEDEKNPRVVR